MPPKFGVGVAEDIAPRNHLAHELVSIRSCNINDLADPHETATDSYRRRVTISAADSAKARESRGLHTRNRQTFQHFQRSAHDFPQAGAFGRIDLL